MSSDTSNMIVPKLITSGTPAHGSYIVLLDFEEPTLIEAYYTYKDGGRWLAGKNDITEHVVGHYDAFVLYSEFFTPAEEIAKKKAKKLRQKKKRKNKGKR